MTFVYCCVLLNTRNTKKEQLMKSTVISKWMNYCCYYEISVYEKRTGNVNRKKYEIKKVQIV